MKILNIFLRIKRTFPFLKVSYLISLKFSLSLSYSYLTIMLGTTQIPRSKLTGRKDTYNRIKEAYKCSYTNLKKFTAK